MNFTTPSICDKMPFEKNKFYCLDGGFASHLSTHFTSKIDGDPLWSCRALHDDPKAVVSTHVDFINAGANIITTNTYQVITDPALELRIFLFFLLAKWHSCIRYVTKASLIFSGQCWVVSKAHQGLQRSSSRTLSLDGRSRPFGWRGRTSGYKQSTKCSYRRSGHWIC